MKGTVKKMAAAVLAVLLCALVLVGCMTERDDGTDADERITLRVVTVMEDRFLSQSKQIEQWIEKFETEHENVDIEILNLSTMEETAKARLRTELMAGKGPDVLLLQTAEWWQHLTAECKTNPLIADVQLAMKNGLFYDISEFYDADTALGIDALEPTVMNAGILDGKRYVLPLRYNMLVAYVDKALFEESGMSLDLFDQDIISVWNAIVQHGDGRIAKAAEIRGGLNCSLNLIGNLIDYEKQEVLLTKEKLAEYFRAEQEFLIIAAGNQYSKEPILSEYCDDSSSAWMNNGNCMYIGDLDFMIHNAAIARAEGVDLGMYPLKATDGSAVADISMFGAVTRGSEYPELAYEFLRYFLSEEAQWELTVDNGGDRLIGDGWPVRSKGAVSALIERNGLRQRIWELALRGKDKITNADRPQYTDEDVPVVNTAIDKARFPINLEEEFHWINSLDIYNEWTMTEEYARSLDLEAMAETFIRQLEWHLGEG